MSELNQKHNQHAKSENKCEELGDQSQKQLEEQPVKVTNFEKKKGPEGTYEENELKNKEHQQKKKAGDNNNTGNLIAEEEIAKEHHHQKFKINNPFSKNHHDHPHKNQHDKHKASKAKKLNSDSCDHTKNAHQQHQKSKTGSGTRLNIVEDPDAEGENNVNKNHKNVKDSSGWKSSNRSTSVEQLAALFKKEKHNEKEESKNESSQIQNSNPPSEPELSNQQSSQSTLKTDSPKSKKHKQKHKKKHKDKHKKKEVDLVESDNEYNGMSDVVGNVVGNVDIQVKYPSSNNGFENSENTGNFNKRNKSNIKQSGSLKVIKQENPNHNRNRLNSSTARVETPPSLNSLMSSSSDFFSGVFGCEKRDSEDDPMVNNKKIHVTNKCIHVCGRHLREEKHGEISFDWPGVYIVFGVRHSNTVYVEMNGGTNYFNVYVNGSYQCNFGTLFNSRTYRVISGLDENHDYIITLVKRTESSIRTAVTTFKTCTVSNFILWPFSGEMFDPCPVPMRSIEFVGDSDTCAFGVEGKMTPASSIKMNPATNNVDRSYARLVSRRFGALSHCVAWSGKAVSKNPHFLGFDTIPSLFSRSISTSASSSFVQHTLDNQGKDWNPDLVVVLAGANDFFLSPRPRSHDFIVDYKGLVQSIRQKYKDCWIACLTLGEDAVASVDSIEETREHIHTLRECIKLSVSNLRIKDEKVVQIDLTGKINLKRDADFALLMHWNPHGHAVVANALIEALSEKIGWKDEMSQPRDEEKISIENEMLIKCFCPAIDSDQENDTQHDDKRIYIEKK